MGRRVGCRIGGDCPSQLGGRLETSAEPGDGHLDDPVMAPLKEGVSETAGQPHRALHHLEGPGHFDPRSSADGFHSQARLAFDVTVDDGVNGDGWIPPGEFDLQAHPVRKGRGHHRVQHGPGAQGLTLETEFLQPRPPAFVLVDLIQYVPQLRRNEAELVGPLVFDHRLLRHKEAQEEPAVAKAFPCTFMSFNFDSVQTACRHIGNTPKLGREIPSYGNLAVSISPFWCERRNESWGQGPSGLRRRGHSRLVTPYRV